MAAQILDGKLVANRVRACVRRETQDFIARTGVTPCLAVILAGEDPASQIYVKNKKLACEKCGFLSKEFLLPETVSQKELEDLVLSLNKDKTVHGILVQQPLPKGIDVDRINSLIDPLKDVDGFHPVNTGKLMIGSHGLRPCTPAGILEILDAYDIPIEGRECVVVGRSNLVGKPAAMLMLSRNATVTMCHSRTKDLASVTKRADILIVAIGKPKFITADMIKEGTVVIDVGVNRTEDGIFGDVDFENAKEVASYITPVPGGVGRMTIAMLMKNTLEAAMQQAEKERP